VRSTTDARASNAFSDDDTIACTEATSFPSTIAAAKFVTSNAASL
jgi:hypothetical protein